jgi:TolB protein
LNTHRHLLIAVIGLTLLMTGSLQAALNIKITRGIEGALPIAITPFAWQGQSAEPPTKVAPIIASDLERSGRFAPLSHEEFPAHLSQTGDEIPFADWRALGTGNLVTGSLSQTADNIYTVEFRLFDVYRGSQVSGFRFQVEGIRLRSAAHRIADIVYEKLTGEPGAFATRIAYITERVFPDATRQYALHVADSDGENAQLIVQSSEPLLSPAWSPDGRRLAYVSFEGHRTRVFVQELTTAQRQVVASYPGLNSAPAWSPDGSKLALALSKDGNPEVYVLDLASRRLQRLTHSTAIDTEPAWAPDGESLAFTSDRGGRPQIYRISTAAGRPERVTFEGDYNARATFSPDGEKLALVHGDGERYRIALLDLSSNSLRLLTNTDLDESPSFAPNGSMIIYATLERDEALLAAVSIDGRVQHRLNVEGRQVREPAWSPFLRPQSNRMAASDLKH